MDLLIGAVDTQTAISTGSNISSLVSAEFWGNIFQKGIFGRVANAALIVAGIAVIYRGYNILEEARKNDYDPGKLVSSILSVILALGLLLNQGQLAKDVVLGFRSLTSGVTDQLIAGIVADFSFSGAGSIASQLNSQEDFSTFQRELEICSRQVDQNTCGKNSYQRLKLRITAQNPSNPEALRAMAQLDPIFTIPSTGPAPTDTLGQASSAISGFVQGVMDLPAQIIKLLLTATSIAFFLAIEVAMLLYGMIFPFAVALGILNWNSLISWMSNFWALANAKICYTIISGIVLSLEQWSKNNNGFLAQSGLFVIELLLAIGGPILTYIYVSGSSLAFAKAASDANVAIAKGVGSTGKKLAGGIGRSMRRFR